MRCLVGLAAVVAGVDALVAPRWARALPPPLRGANDFHAEGDSSGDYVLSGMWELTRRPMEEVFVTREVRLQHRQSWSGQWSSSRLFRFKPKKSKVLVILNPSGWFETPPDTDEKLAVHGKWSCDGRTVVLSRFGRGSNVMETYEGSLREHPAATGSNETAVIDIVGNMGYGAHEPEYSGKFEMARVMQQLNPLLRKATPVRTTPVFTRKHLEGKWTLQLVTEDSASIFIIALTPDGNWRTVEGLTGPGFDADDPDAPRLAGRWNVYDRDIDLGSGIAGEGSKVWLWLRRFASAPNAGTGNLAVSKGVNLSADHLYVGRIKGGRVSETDPTATRARQVRGTIALGWSIEPAFIGQFHMKRWLADGDLTDDAPDDDEKDDDDNNNNKQQQQQQQ